MKIGNWRFPINIGIGASCRNINRPSGSKFSTDKLSATTETDNCTSARTVAQLGGLESLLMVVL